MSGKVALVTGGLHRVGAAIAARLARESYMLALHGRNDGEPDAALAQALAETGVAAQIFTADLADAADVAALVPDVAAHFGRAPDVLVNNASLFGQGGWETLTAESLALHYQVNCAAPVMLAKAVVEAAGDGQVPAIVHILDQRVLNPPADQTAYTLSKQALWQATRTLAVAFGPKARVNAVAPGMTLPTDDFTAGQMERLAGDMPLGLLPTPEQIADAVAYLAGAKATSGQTIFVDGGAHLTAFRRDFLFMER
ncbi:short-chain dehydrogenase [Pseudonocardia sp. TMWB2A]|uniref:SDR family oxidoreductase n=1 Tax=Pseudonocardia sp. TMWB2A TaxID=687430 RepID=UPI00307E4AF8